MGEVGKSRGWANGRGPPALTRVLIFPPSNETSVSLRRMGCAQETQVGHRLQGEWWAMEGVSKEGEKAEPRIWTQRRGPHSLILSRTVYGAFREQKGF